MDIPWISVGQTLTGIGALVMIWIAIPKNADERKNMGAHWAAILITLLVAGVIMLLLQPLRG